jgi:hypothetical protein
LADHFGPVIREAGGDLLIAGHLHQNIWLDEKTSGLGFPMLINGNTSRVEASGSESKMNLRVVTEKNEVIHEKELNRK